MINHYSAIPHKAIIACLNVDLFAARPNKMNVTSILQSYSNTTWWANWFQSNLTGNLTQVREGRYLDLQEQIVILYDSAVVNDVQREALVLEQVPPGINVFALLNVGSPPNISHLEGWKIIYSRNSSSYSNISTLLEVS